MRTATTAALVMLAGMVAPGGPPAVLAAPAAETVSGPQRLGGAAARPRSATVPSPSEPRSSAVAPRPHGPVTPSTDYYPYDRRTGGM